MYCGKVSEKQPVVDHIPLRTKRHALFEVGFRQLRVMLFAILLILAGAGLSCAPNADPADADGRQRPGSVNRQLQAQSNPKIADSQAVNQDSDKVQHDELINKAQARGRLRVMVQLNYDAWRPEGELPDDRAVEQQRRRIIQLQDKILAQLAGFDVRGVKKFKYTPQMAMEVDAVALRQLINSPDVAGISEDSLARPTF